MKLSFQLTPIVVLISMFWCGVAVSSAQESDQRYVASSSVAPYYPESPLYGRQTDDEVKQEILQKINPLRKPMSALSVDVRETSENAPQDWSDVLMTSYPDTWTEYAPSPIGYAWTAPNIRYQPLYYENVRLERYGQTRGPWREVFDSSLHFGSSFFLWPYHARFDHVRSCDHPLGFCRPGNYVQATKQLQWWGW